MLVKQQQEALEEFLPAASVNSLRGDSSDCIQLQKNLEDHDIIVMTPQMLVNAYNEAIDREQPIFRIGLMIFDECHHCQKNHPYNQLLEIHHLHLTARNESLPRVFFLSIFLTIFTS